MSKMVITFPHTIYSVALVYLNKTHDKHLVSAQVVQVNGNDPLLTEEVISRACKQFEENWNEVRWGKRSDWVKSNAVDVKSHTIG